MERLIIYFKSRRMNYMTYTGLSQEDRDRYLYKDVSTHDINRADIIKEVVSQVTGITELERVTRKRETAEARQIAMFLISKYTRLTLYQIGDLFGGKDHATVVHAKRKITNLIGFEKELRSTIDRCMELIESRIK